MTFKTNKMACSSEPFTIDWSDFYAALGLNPVDNPISPSIWVLSGGSSVLESINGSDTTVEIDGGTPGAVLMAKNIIKISGTTFGDCRTIYIMVK